MDYLASRGVRFMNAQANHVICAPSRASFLSGLYGSSTKNVGFDVWYKNRILKSVYTIPEFFRKECYKTVGTGKINHNELRSKNSGLWDEHFKMYDYGPYPYDGEKKTHHPHQPQSVLDASDSIDMNFRKLSDFPYPDSKNANAGWVYTDGEPFRYVSEEDRDPLPDEYNADWAVEKIKEFEARDEEDQEQPWLIAVGFTNPHTPMYCPDRF